MSPNRRFFGLVPAALLACGLAGACSSQRHDDEHLAIGERAVLPQLTLRDDTPDLWLTWVDDKGETHTAIHPADVPDAGREHVRVVLGDREDGTRSVFYVADLTKTSATGGYVVTTVPRRAWEDDIAKRRDAFLATVAPPPAPTGAASAGPTTTEAAPGGVMVIIYGASWCGACHEAANYLKSKHIPYVLKDIEAMPSAAAEMQEKLARAGRRGGSIPVIDVGGQILVGFAPAASTKRSSGRAITAGPVAISGRAALPSPLRPHGSRHSERTSMQLRGGMNEIVRQAARMQRKIEDTKKSIKDKEVSGTAAGDKVLGCRDLRGKAQVDPCRAGALGGRRDRSRARRHRGSRERCA